jgi:hypothetical protein
MGRVKGVKSGKVKCGKKRVREKGEWVKGEGRVEILPILNPFPTLNTSSSPFSNPQPFPFFLPSTLPPVHTLNPNLNLLLPIFNPSLTLNPFPLSHPSLPLPYPYFPTLELRVGKRGRVVGWKRGRRKC